MSKSAIQAIIIYFVGYFLAVVAAALVTTIIFVSLNTLMQSIAHTQPSRFVTMIPMFFLGGTIITAITALPGFVLTMVVTALVRRYHWVFYTLAGAATALAAILFVSNFSLGALWREKYLVFACLVGGACGGYTFHHFRIFVLFR